MENDRKQLLSLVLYFGHELFFDSSSDEETEEISKICGISDKIVPAMSTNQFKIHFRLNVDVFETLLQKLHSIDRKRVTVGHPEISIDKGCVIMIWYLGNLESLRSAKAETIIGKFKRRYGMPGIIGAVDGTHIRINAPKEYHCSYINRKNYHSILLQGVCDSELLFIDIYTGQPGSVHDATLFKKSNLYNRISTNNIDFSNNTHIIGDKAYPLATYLMVPYKDNGNLTPREKNFNLILIMSATILHNLCILCDDKVEELFSMEKEILEESETAPVVNACEEIRNRGNAAATQKRRDIVNSLPLII
ncbi:hypothetical protein ILUMI_26113 [Ignelater luminosus]|uniref:DDE Tnp4 domain-containing protein n=1 Tax=Ignelater luminosus TaxID=2038154 RepID=A0A8K0C4N2_IGNLU|nr:hypothetical protein ILUMI_26113 [Ignelater luminosus]